MVNVRHGRLKVSVTLHMSLSWNKIARNLVLIANKVSLNYFIRIYLIADFYAKPMLNVSQIYFLCAYQTLHLRNLNVLENCAFNDCPAERPFCYTNGRCDVGKNLYTLILWLSNKIILIHRYYYLYFTSNL